MPAARTLGGAGRAAAAALVAGHAPDPGRPGRLARQCAAFAEVDVAVGDQVHR